jgi:hypothetical protein
VEWSGTCYDGFPVDTLPGGALGTIVADSAQQPSYYGNPLLLSGGQGVIFKYQSSLAAPVEQAFKDLEISLDTYGGGGDYDVVVKVAGERCVSPPPSYSEYSRAGSATGLVVLPGGARLYSNLGHTSKEYVTVELPGTALGCFYVFVFRHDAAATGDPGALMVGSEFVYTAASLPGNAGSSPGYCAAGTPCNGTINVAQCP